VWVTRRGRAEVYLAHHHDEVVVSVPGEGARGELLRGLTGASGVFTDVSGYAFLNEEDEEDGGGEE
jgi:hypothetical protein